MGGGPNDAATKAPFQRAVEARFPDVAACWRLAEAPAKGGSFGVDLRIPAGGGRPAVGAPRTSLRGEALRRCLLEALGTAEFEPQRRGPTTISYSLQIEP